MELLTWFENTGLSLWVKESNYGYYILLNGHAIGMALVVGVVLMLDLRVLGYAKRLPTAVFDRLFALGWAGFALNFVTGLILFLAQGQRYLANTPFLIKILLIVLGGLSMWVLGRILGNPERTSSQGAISTGGKAFALFSIVFWIGAIVAGRLIAYTLGPPPPPTL